MNRMHQDWAAARVDHTIAISFAAVVFCTGHAWIMPLMQWCLPDFGNRLATLPHSIRMSVCGGTALVVAAVLTIILMRISRRK